MLKKLILLVSTCLLIVAMTGCLDTLARASKVEEGLAVQIILIVDAPKGYNQYTSHPDSIYYPLDIVWVYMDIKNISFEMRDKGNAIFGRWVSIEQSLKLIDSNGVIVLEYPGFLSEGFLPDDYNLNEIYFLNYINIPQMPDVGEYTIVITITDYIKDVVVTDSVKFEIRLDKLFDKKFI